MATARQIGATLTVLLAAGTGFFVGTTAHVAVANSGPRPGHWRCFAADLVVDGKMKEAAEWRDAKMLGGVLDQVAPDAPVGSVTGFTRPATYIPCVKYAE